VKRSLDLCAAVALFVLLSPVLVFLALLIRARLGTPVLFAQTRIGRFEKPFTLYKLRSMRDAVDSQGKPLPDAERLSSFGCWLRSWSLDELPQLWNILRGEMSFIGPRPLLPEYLPRYSARQRRRHEVRPGLSGWAQVHGRNAITWERRLELDVEYVESRSMLLDIRIAALTLRKLLQRDGVNQAGHATMDIFRGVNDSG
jgi:lipopolysaccharide/colanic/teichoic acid biosynthesis glycosyltransferase